MAKFACSKVVDLLLDRFPEFKETEGFQLVRDDLELPYVVWGAFGRFITAYMRRLPADGLDGDELVNRVLDFANELMDAGDDETQNIVVIELFENFYMYRKTLELGRRKLKSQHATSLEKQGLWLGTSDLHYEGELLAPKGLDGLRALLSGCSWGVKVIRPGRGEPPRLEANDDRIDLQTDPGTGPRFTFFGDAKREEEARRLLGELSGCLVRGDIAHSIDLHRTTGRSDILIGQFQHRWSPETCAQDADGP